MLPKLTLEQKIELLGGVSTWYTHAEPSIGLSSIRLSDGPAGLRSGIPAIAYPAPIALAATWDPKLAEEMGGALGHDARARGVDVLLGPGVDIARAPMGGRNFEYLGEDPWLASRIAVAYIEGVQAQGVSATIKHFALNDQEYNRHNSSSDADERTMREIGLPAFEAAVKEAHVGAIMDSYNLVNGIHSTENGWLNNTVAKQEWGFTGVIMSDWNSVYDGVAAVNHGLDLEMPFLHYLGPDTLLPAVHDGRVSEATIDDHVRRILRLVLRFGANNRAPDDSVSLFSESSDATALKIARESIVLLKNDGHVLPLDSARTCTLAVIGPGASPAVMGGGGSAVVTTHKSVSILEGSADFLHAVPAQPGCAHTVLYDSGVPDRYDVFHATRFDHGLAEQAFAARDFSGPSANTTRRDLNENRITTSRTGSIRFTGQFTAPSNGAYYAVVHDGRPTDRHTLYVDGQRLADPAAIETGTWYIPLPHPLSRGQAIQIRLDYLPNDVEVYPGLGIIAADDIVSPRARRIARASDTVLIAAGFDKATEHEGADRTFALPALQNDLIRNVAALNPHTILALTGGGNVDMNPWIDHVPALLHLWYPGEEGGTALADVLFGVQNPEGKLPVSFERRWEDNPSFKSYYPVGDPNELPCLAGDVCKGRGAPAHVRYSEGVFLGYRYYASPAINTEHLQPRFPFGFGLSYTTFAFSDLRINRNTARPDDPITITLTVRNTGSVAGAEVAQVYVGEQNPKVPRPHYELKAFQKIRLAAGESRTIALPLNRRSFAYWSDPDHDWKVDPGIFTIYAGDSSDNLPLHTDLTLQ
ncbi:MAG TPA: glycoside hydrolase family 3 C-terminal domain-containing protein [Acidobacteriaceae bacterium]